jgi:hypothetical protein
MALETPSHEGLPPRARSTPGDRSKGGTGAGDTGSWGDPSVELAVALGVAMRYGPFIVVAATPCSRRITRDTQHVLPSFDTYGVAK